MTDVTLHGYPVKVGDEVWSVICLQWGKVFSVISESSVKNMILPMFEIVFKTGELVNHSEKTIFWQPINPSAIEAAKVKPKQVEYEWQWLCKNTITECCESSRVHYKTEESLKSSILPNWEILYRIEESKREVKL